MMTRLINLAGQALMWWSVAKYIFAMVVVALLIGQGLHPAWGVLLFIFRRVAFRMCVLLGLLWWLTRGLI